MHEKYFESKTFKLYMMHFKIFVVGYVLFHLKVCMRSYICLKLQYFLSFAFSTRVCMFCEITACSCLHYIDVHLLVTTNHALYCDG